MDKQFIIEEQYQMYLQRVGLKESAMHEQQKVQTKRAFFGAWGQMLVLMQGAIPDLPESDGVKVLESMIDQVAKFWLSQGNRNN
jgi:hypothetical protein